MTPLDTTLPPVWEGAGFLIGFVLSLLILSFIIRDSWLVRGAQYLLVGVTLAYTVVLVWSNVLWPRLLGPLLETPALPWNQPSDALWNETIWNQWLPLVGGLLLWAAGVEQIRRRSASGAGGGAGGWLRHPAALLLAMLVGVALGTGVAGAIQGTLWPQLRQATGSGALLSAPPGLLLSGLLTLLVTGGALLHLQATTGQEKRLPGPLGPLLLGWAWLGERALWLAAGVIFARLFASRSTLLIARLDALFFHQQSQETWRWLLSLVGGG